MKQQRVKNKHKSDKENLTLVIYHLCSLPRSRFLDVTQRERCVTSQKKKTPARKTTTFAEREKTPLYYLASYQEANCSESKSYPRAFIWKSTVVFLFKSKL